MVIVFHIGTNDLLSVDAFCIRQCIFVLFEDTVTMYPQSQIIWSDILPRVFYFGTTAQASMDRKRRSINKWAKSRLYQLGGHVIHHPQFHWTTMQLFRYDGVLKGRKSPVCVQLGGRYLFLRLVQNILPKSDLYLAACLSLGPLLVRLAFFDGNLTGNGLKFCSALSDWLIISSSL